MQRKNSENQTTALRKNKYVQEYQKEHYINNSELLQITKRPLAELGASTAA